MQVQYIDRYDTHFRNKIKVVLEQDKKVIASEHDLIEIDLKDLTSKQIEEIISSVSSKLEEMTSLPKELVKSVKIAKEKFLKKEKSMNINVR